MFYVYSVFNKTKNKIYIGQTNDIERRIKEHNTKTLNAGHYTSKFLGRWELIYQEKFSIRSAAIAREKELKSHKGRNFLRDLMATK